MHEHPGTGRRILAVAGLLLLTALVYSQVVSHAFLEYDDIVYIGDNPHVRSGLSWENLRWALTAQYDVTWFPVTWLSHMLDVSLFGISPGPHHAVNLLLHLGNTGLLLLLLQRLTGAFWRSFMVAALFALHPLHVESVAWLAERKDVLSSFFLLLMLLAYRRYVDRPAAARYLAVLALYALGLASKAMLISAPLLLLVLDFWPLQRHGQASPIKLLATSRIWVEKIPLALLALATGVITYFAQRSGEAVDPLAEQLVGLNIANALVSYVRYLGQLWWPTDLAILYPFQPALPWWQPTLAAIAIAAAVGAAFRAAPRYPYLLAGLGWYLVTLLPVIGFMRFGAQSHADRYTYIPLVGIFMVMVWGGAALVARFSIRPVVVGTVGLAIIGVLSTLTVRQLRHWQDTYTIFTHALAVTRDNWLCHSNLAGYLVKHGRLAEALPHVQEVLRINPANQEIKAKSYTMLGMIYNSQQRWAEAIPAFQAALALEPRQGEALYYLGKSYLYAGRRTEAQAVQQQLAGVHPDFARYLANDLRLFPAQPSR